MESRGHAEHSSRPSSDHGPVGQAHGGTVPHRLRARILGEGPGQVRLRQDEKEAARDARQSQKRDFWVRASRALRALKTRLPREASCFSKNETSTPPLKSLGIF